MDGKDVLLERMGAEEAPPVSKANYVLGRLRRDMADGTLQPGAALHQADIARRYGVSVTPVREALRLLEAEGRINRSPHRSATVLDLLPTDIKDLYLLRAEVEGFTAQLAAERRTPEGLTPIQQLQSELEKKSANTHAVDLSALNRRFHFAIAAMGSDLIASHVLDPLWDRFTPPSTSIWADPTAISCFLDEHRAIIGAIRDGDAVTARERMATHVMTAERLRQQLAGTKD